MLEDTYSRLQSMLDDSMVESLDAIRLVDEYREYWRPEVVNIILLAESHVFTTLEDMDISFETPLQGYPTQYAKFVYCLAYGERTLTADPRHPPRDGTPQFWKIFYSCANNVDNLHDFSPMLSKTPFEQRLQNKISLLTDLKRMGVWLLDTSIAALYHGGKKPAKLSEALECSWKSYTLNVVRTSKPKHVICVGKEVGRIASGDLRRDMPNSFTVLPQPNARLSTERHMDAFRTYYRVCSEHCVS